LECLNGLPGSIFSQDGKEKDGRFLQGPNRAYGIFGEEMADRPEMGCQPATAFVYFFFANF
jgi:hypothetical protein